MTEGKKFNKKSNKFFFKGQCHFFTGKWYRFGSLAKLEVPVSPWGHFSVLKKCKLAEFLISSQGHTSMTINRWPTIAPSIFPYKVFQNNYDRE